jgi:hypothetical protein
MSCGTDRRITNERVMTVQEAANRHGNDKVADVVVRSVDHTTTTSDCWHFRMRVWWLKSIHPAEMWSERHVSTSSQNRPSCMSVDRASVCPSGSLPSLSLRNFRTLCFRTRISLFGIEVADFGVLDLEGYPPGLRANVAHKLREAATPKPRFNIGPFRLESVTAREDW